MAKMNTRNGIVSHMDIIRINGALKSLVPVKTERVTPKHYLELVQSRETSNIKHVRFVPPEIGSGGFGSFVVEYRDMKLVPAND